jgi:peptidoglycan DL-endopeptidase RipA
MYAWAQFDFVHLASTQYTQGSVHPNVASLMPGDLVFWSDGGQLAIHHVAIYVGNGNVIQAPQSGDIVRITPLDQMGPGYFGATRPLT